MCTRSLALATAVAAAAARLTGVTAGTASAAGPAAPCDLNGDGYDDLAVGKPGEGVGDAYRAGAVNVLYGSSTGLTGTGSEVLHQDAAGVPDIGEDGDEFGGSSGSGLLLRDLDKDGRADLTVCAPGEGRDAGRVWSFHGTADGTTATGSVAFDAASLKPAGPTRRLYFGLQLRG